MDLATVVYGPELGLLKVQAQSIDLYASEIENIHVVINDDTAIEIDKSWWGRYRDRVEISHYTDYRIPLMNCGWDQQQICKLMAAKNAAKWSLILDAKTWFVREFSPGDFFHQGKPALKTVDIQPVFEPGWRFLLGMWNINYTDQIIGPGGVPYLMDSDLVKEIEKELQELGWKNLVEFFCQHVMHPYFITEFNLYSSYALKKYQCYSNMLAGEQKFKTINIAVGQEPEFENLFRDMQEDGTLTVSMHRNCDISADQRRRWACWLQEKKLNI